MTKKILIAIIILLLLIVIGGGLTWYLSSDSGTTSIAPSASSSPIVPFPVATDRDVTVTPQGSGSFSSTTEGSQFGVSESPSELYSKAVAGHGYISVGTSTFLILMDRDSGNLYVRPNEERQTPTRVTNTTLLGVQRAWWGETKGRIYPIVSSREGGASRITIYSIKKTEIKSALASTSPSSLVKELSFDGAGVGVAVSPVGSRVLVHTKTVNGTRLEILDLATLKRTPLSARIALKELSAQWISADLVLLNTRPSFSSPGISFLLNTRTDNLSIDGKAISNYSSLTDSSLGYTLFTDGAQSKITRSNATSTQILSLVASPQKCVWDSVIKGLLYCAVPRNQGEFFLQIDGWLRGERVSSDDLWWIDTLHSSADILAKFSEGVDGVDLLVSPNHQSIVLKNKLTGRLIEVPIPQETSD